MFHRTSLTIHFVDDSFDFPTFQLAVSLSVRSILVRSRYAMKVMSMPSTPASRPIIRPSHPRPVSRNLKQDTRNSPKGCVPVLCFRYPDSKRYLQIFSSYWTMTYTSKKKEYIQGLVSWKLSIIQRSLMALSLAELSTFAANHFPDCFHIFCSLHITRILAQNEIVHNGRHPSAFVLWDFN